jgi:hypothetical protein
MRKDTGEAPHLNALNRGRGGHGAGLRGAIACGIVAVGFDDGLASEIQHAGSLFAADELVGAVVGII